MNSNQKVPTELGTQPIGSLLLKYALPAIIAMTASSLLNNVDRFFISRCVGPDAISGLGATMPFMNLGAAFGAMVGVGASAVMSIRLGQRDYKTAQHVLGNTITLNILISLLVSAICWMLLDPFTIYFPEPFKLFGEIDAIHFPGLLNLFGASERTAPFARPYMLVILGGGIITHSYLGLNAVIRSTGHPTFSMCCTITTVVSNALLDWLFVWVLDTGITGAAWATVLAQAIGLCMEFVVLSRRSELVHLQRGIYRLKAKIVRQILVIGLSPFLLNACACLVVLLINQGMRQHGGDYALGAYSIVNGVVFFFLMIVMGVNQGMQPIVGYNWGAHQNDRVWKTLRFAIFAATCVTTVGFLVGELCPELVTSLFSDGDSAESQQILAMSTRGFRIDVMVLPLVGSQMVIGNFFQSIGHAGKSIFMSLSRQLLFLVPGILILPNYFGLDGVWYAIPLSDALSVFCSFTLLYLLVRKVKRKDHEAATGQQQK